MGKDMGFPVSLWDVQRMEKGGVGLAYIGLYLYLLAKGVIGPPPSASELDYLQRIAASFGYELPGVGGGPGVPGVRSGAGDGA
jgi:hypothetical protein